MIDFRTIIAVAFVLGAFAGLGTGCRKKTAAAKAIEKFESTFGRLPRLEPGPVSPGEWPEVRARDALALRFSPGYQERNASCWEKNRERWPGPGWIDLCLSREDPEMVEFIFHLQPAVDGGAGPEPSDDARQNDIVVYDSWHAEAGLLGGRRAIVERARASGGMVGYKRQRKMSALIEPQPGTFARFGGSTGDDAGYDELLAVAATVRSTGAPGPSE